MASNLWLWFHQLANADRHCGVGLFPEWGGVKTNNLCTICMSIAEIFRCGAIFLPLKVWVFLFISTQQAQETGTYGKLVHHGRSRSFKVIEIGPVESTYATC